MLTEQERLNRFLGIMAVVGIPMWGIMHFVPKAEPPKVERDADWEAYQAQQRAKPPARTCRVNAKCPVLHARFGCLDSSVGDRIASYAKQGDDEAFKRLMVRAVVSGQCRAFNEGDTVYKQEGGFFMSCLRVPGEDACFWTDRNAVED